MGAESQYKSFPEFSAGPVKEEEKSRVFHIEKLSDDIDIRGLFLTLWRRRMVIIGVMLLGLGFAYLITQFISPRYSAKALVLFERSTNQRAAEDILSLVSNLRIDTTLVLNEIEVLRSRTLAKRVVEQLDLVSDPEFNPYLRKKTSWEEIFSLSSFVDIFKTQTNQTPFKQLNIPPFNPDTLPPEIREASEALAVTIFLSKLRARSIPGSYVMQVEFVSGAPDKAAHITNSIIDIYIEMRLEEKFKAAQKISGWLDKRLSDLRTQVRQSEQAVQDYRQKFDLTKGMRTDISAEQISELAAQLVDARAKLAEADARFEQIQGAGGNLSRIEISPAVAASPIIQELKRNEVALKRKLSELSNQYGERHPEIIKTKAELETLTQTLRKEMFQVARTIEGEVLVAQARVRALENGFNEISGQRHRENEDMIQLRELEREADSSRLIFDKFLEKHKRSDEQEQLQEADAKVISYASIPRRASFPNKMLILSLASAVSLFIGLAISFLLEKLDNTFRSANQLEGMTGYPCYALIPGVEGISQKQKDIVSYILNKPASTIAESVRTLRMVLNLRTKNKGAPPKIVTVTSSFPGEGKTTLSIWLARLAAKSGERVLLIDCDLRRPNIHRSLQKSNERSLVEFLAGKDGLENLIQTDDPSGMHVLYGRSVPNSALDLVSSARMKKLLESLKQVYDLVIIDSPACLAVSDARVLATLSDQTLYVVSWDHTPREVVLSGTKQFSDIHYEPLAFVLGGVDVKRHVKYGYGDTMYYYGRYKEYYSE